MAPPSAISRDIEHQGRGVLRQPGRGEGRHFPGWQGHRAAPALEMGRNLIHGSDGPESAQREIALFFGDTLLDYTRAIAPWVFE